MAVDYRPNGYHTVTPYLTVRGVEQVLDFIQRALDGVPTTVMRRPDGSVGHAEVRVGDSMVMLGEAPADGQPMPSMLYLYVPDSDLSYRRAIEAGATSLRPPETQFYGDRHGAVVDPGGNQWWLATHVEDVSPEEMKRRMSALQPQP